MTALAPGPAPTRSSRKSDLLFGWRAADGTLDAYAGQVGTKVDFINPGAVPGMVIGRDGNLLTAGRNMPRFETVVGRGGVTRLVVEGEVTGQYVEQVSYPWPLKVMPLAVWLRIWPFYAPGSNQAQPWYALTLGQGTANGGRLTFRRFGTQWEVLRTRSATTISSAFTESGSTVYPIDLLATLSSAGTLQLVSRDASGLVQTGSPATDSNMMVTTDTWDQNVLTLNGVTGLVLPGGQWRYEQIKIARDPRTMADMDLLS